VLEGQVKAPEAPSPARVLLVEDDPRTATMIGEMLRVIWSQGLVIAHAERLGDATQELLDHRTTCVLLELADHEGDGLAGLKHVRAAAPDAPIIVLSDSADDGIGLRALQAGAQDCLLKTELHPALLSRAITYAVERKRSEVQIVHQAFHDPLTALPNRALFLDRLGVALDRSRRTKIPVAVLFLDVDKFKLINDSLGHSAGDQVLIGLADRLREMLRPMDTMARFGGDEFTFVFEGVESEQAALLILERISRTASLPMRLNHGEASITVSIGLAIVTDPALAPEDIIRDADSAMYRAKQQGGSRYELFDESLRRRARERLELQTALDQAIKRSELRVHYQPRVSLNGETRLVGFEALVRWEHPERGLIPPDQFIGVAEDTRLILPIGEYVLGQALRQIGRWSTTLPGLTISVNLSPRQVEDRDLVTSVASAIRASGADPSTLCVEITEATIQHNAELATSTLRDLKTIGVQVAIDNFGTGYSSLSSLKQLPVDTLKIHQSFVSKLDTDPAAADIVGAVVELAHALRLNVVAEGVETDTQLARLRQLRCDQAQGFLFSQPVPPDQVYALLGSP
jgi:diguanylate cyclase (GGDEF)-like protein